MFFVMYNFSMGNKLSLPIKKGIIFALIPIVIIILATEGPRQIRSPLEPLAFVVGVVPGFFTILTNVFFGKIGINLGLTDFLGIPYPRGVIVLILFAFALYFPIGYMYGKRKLRKKRLL